MAGHYVTLAEGPILIAVGTPQEARAAISVVRRLHLGLERSVALLHASDPPFPAEEILRMLELNSEELGSAVVTPLAGEPAQAILRYAADHRGSLLVMGLTTNGGGLSVLTERLISEAPCPVLLVPPRVRLPWDRGGKVLLPLDGTPSTAAAVPWATELAVQLQAAIEIVYVAGAPPPAEAGSLPLPSLLDAPHYEWSAWRREFLSRFCECHWEGEHPVELGLMVQTGEPGEAILRAAGAVEPDLVVIGWHGVLTQARAKTLRTVLLKARWPVLTVRVPRG